MKRWTMKRWTMKRWTVDVRPLGAGPWKLEVARWTLDVGSWTLDTLDTLDTLETLETCDVVGRRWTSLDFQRRCGVMLWTLDVLTCGRWMLDFGCWMLDVPALDVDHWTLDVGRKTLDVECFFVVGCWILDVGRWFGWTFTRRTSNFRGCMMNDGTLGRWDVGTLGRWTLGRWDVGCWFDVGRSTWVNGRSHVSRLMLDVER